MQVGDTGQLQHLRGDSAIYNDAFADIVQEVPAMSLVLGYCLAGTYKNKNALWRVKVWQTNELKNIEKWMIRPIEDPDAEIARDENEELTA